MQGRVLIVDDDESLCRLLALKLKAMSFQALFRTSGAAALEALQAEDADVVLTDLNMTGMSGLELCQRVAATRPDLPVVVLTAHGTFDSVVGALRAGAYDFAIKPPDMETLGMTLSRAVERHRLRQEVNRLRRAVAEGGRFADLLGSSPAMQRLFDLLDRVAESESSVLIIGESGTGKEVVARALWSRGKRKDGPFVAVNCAAVPEQLLESELFGHAKGAFTDARSARAGLFQQADGGTLFLDEIGDMPIHLQVKVLRALQERKVRPVGADAEVPVDLRLIAATNKDLETAIAEGKFRQDLYFRLNVIQVDLPPLRARGGDVLVLAQHFLQIFAARANKGVTGLSPEVAKALTAYSWPGNVRELQNCIERAVALTRGDQLVPDDLPERIRAFKSSHVVVAGDDPSELIPMEEVERRYISRVMQSVGGNKTLAARVLGFDRTTLYRKLERYGLVSSETPPSRPNS
ncbi:sigma-54-dependent transcriptional regulator [Hyalangium minutum]|uniref:Response regulator of zinc sigma-54-dependent two-component system n=1 Tax=Hyalangium minutum TaxID=394096 RepID=A0A085WCE4_9BACT|nr:sigma-54 dependent transcriptional regulator [Hyalangium minutum]KFE65357.1 Response regulator of zinc sigma-54-dependent two-component system [Hyalangium minutum]